QVLLVDVDGNPATQDPTAIFHGNLQIHISGCDKAPRPGLVPLPDEIGNALDETSSLPAELSFGLPRPNPTGTGMTLQYSLPKDALVSAKVFDVAGRVVRDLGDGPVAAGVHVLSWDLQNDSGQRVSPGLFFVRLARGPFVTRRQVRGASCRWRAAPLVGVARAVLRSARLIGFALLRPPGPVRPPFGPPVGQLPGLGPRGRRLHGSHNVAKAAMG